MQVFLRHNALRVVRNTHKRSHLVAAPYKLLANLGYLKMFRPVMLADHQNPQRPVLFFPNMAPKVPVKHFQSIRKQRFRT